MHSFPGVGSVTRTSYGLSTIRILRTRGDDFIITSIGEEGRFLNMYAESAYWILSSVMMVAATLVGFVLIAAVFFIERFKVFFDLVNSVFFSIMGTPVRTFKIQDKEFDEIADAAQSGIKDNFYNFLSTLIISLLLGILTVILAMTSLSALPTTGQQLTPEQSEGIVMVEVLFVFFMVAMIVVVVYWVYLGFDMAVFKSKHYQDLRYVVEQWPTYTKRVQARIDPIIAGKVKEEEARLGRTLGKDELQSLLDSVQDENSELGQRLAKIMQEEKKGMPRVAAVEAERAKRPRRARKKG